jgi:branched-chain amino acid aminotransferase
MSQKNSHTPSGIEIQTVSQRLDDAARRGRMYHQRFGTVFTEHMVVIRWTKQSGWERGRVEPFGPITLSPAASVLHYGQSIFEGFKAYRHGDGGIYTFRPHGNARRMCASARRLAMPELPVDRFIEAVDSLIRTDQMWVPDEEEHSLYLRPLMFGTQAGLGVRPSEEYMFMIIASPVGSYFPGGVKPVTVWISQDYIRAAPGGTGAAKFAGNYAASLAGQARAIEQGCDQVVWLDATERRYVEEMGGMNIFFVFRDGDRISLVTPDLESGTLLPGVTRDSLLRMASDLGYEAKERRISIDEWEEALHQGRMTEVFACGTAAVITPVGKVLSKAGTWVINKGEIGPVAARLRKELLDLQWGRAEDRYGWMHRVV